MLEVALIGGGCVLVLGLAVTYWWYKKHIET